VANANLSNREIFIIGEDLNKLSFEKAGHVPAFLLHDTIVSLTLTEIKKDVIPKR